MTSSPSPGPDPDARSRAFQPFQTLPGRLVLLSGGLLFLLYAARFVVDLPDVVVLFRRVAAVGFVLGTIWIGAGLIARERRQMLWRVRTKLILSYVFLGVVPVVLVVTFALAGGYVLYNNVAAYLFHEGLIDLYDDVEQAAANVAAELTPRGADAAAVVSREYGNRQARYPGLSLAIVETPAPSVDAVALGAAASAEPDDDRPAPAAPVATAGPWRHRPPPATVPRWSAGRSVSGLLALADSGPRQDEDVLVLRVAMPAADGLAVLADLPIEASVMAALDDQTSTRIRDFGMPCFVGDEGTGVLRTSRSAIVESGGPAGLFNRTVVFTDCIVDWASGDPGRLPVSLDAPVGRIYERLVAAQNPLSELLGTQDFFMVILGAVGVLFLVVQGAALIMGAMLARSITYAVHELAIGTERVQQGDFTHRIRIESSDQLGDLAGSFNKMSASMVHLLHVQREKQRLDEELRIAREIQKSLLPNEPPRIAGLSIADLCEPAREVGGDYYDFFVLGPRRLGVLMADVSGKGTSAALYMAEVKGLLLALSHDEPSPRQLLIDVNRRLAGQLDNRSFITMTYAVIDLEAGVMTHARAGHTPLIVVSGGVSEVIQPDGMVLGLRLPGAENRFAELLEEHQRPIRPGDVVVLYTDGVTEAMDGDGELFGDQGLARVLESHHGLDAIGIRERVVREVRAFARDGEQQDDMTMVVLKLTTDGEGATG